MYLLDRPSYPDQQDPPDLQAKRWNTSRVGMQELDLDLVGLAWAKESGSGKDSGEDWNSDWRILQGRTAYNRTLAPCRWCCKRIVSVYRLEVGDSARM